MKTINAGVHIDNDNDLNIIPLIKNFLSRNYNIISIHIFSDYNINRYSDWAYLPIFYMSFYKESIIFTTLENFLINQYNISSSDIYVITSSEELENNHVSKNALKNIKFLSIRDGEIYEL